MTKIIQFSFCNIPSTIILRMCTFVHFVHAHTSHADRVRARAHRKKGDRQEQRRTGGARKRRTQCPITAQPRCSKKEKKTAQPTTRRLEAATRARGVTCDGGLPFPFRPQLRLTATARDQDQLVVGGRGKARPLLARPLLSGRITLRYAGRHCRCWIHLSDADALR